MGTHNPLIQKKLKFFRNKGLKPRNGGAMPQPVSVEGACLRVCLQFALIHEQAEWLCCTLTAQVDIGQARAPLHTGWNSLGGLFRSFTLAFHPAPPQALDIGFELTPPYATVLYLFGNCP